MIEIDDKKALELLEKAVKGNEGKVYQQPVGLGYCSYVERDDNDNVVSPGCGVAAALHIAGVDLDTLGQLDWNVGSAKHLNDANALRLGLKVTFKAARILAFFQDEQDMNVPWGEALERTKAEYA